MLQAASRRNLALFESSPFLKDSIVPRGNTSNLVPIHEKNYCRVTTNFISGSIGLRKPLDPATRDMRESKSFADASANILCAMLGVGSNDQVTSTKLCFATHTRRTSQLSVCACVFVFHFIICDN